MRPLLARVPPDEEVSGIAVFPVGDRDVSGALTLVVGRTLEVPLAS